MKKYYAIFFSLLIFAFLSVSKTGLAQSNPIANNDTASTIKYKQIAVNVLENDIDPDGDDIEIFDIGTPLYGWVTQVHDSLIYYKCDSRVGLDSLWYKIRKVNNPDFVDMGWLIIDVAPNELPYLTIDTLEAMAGEINEIYIYDIAEDPDGDEFKIQNVSSPVYGLADATSDSTFWFNYPHNFMGLDSMKINLRETKTSTLVPRYLKLMVALNPEYPIAINDTAEAMQGDTIVIQVIQNDFDPQNDLLKIKEANKKFVTDFFDFNDSTVRIVPRASTGTGLYHYFDYSVQEAQNPLHLSNIAGGYLHINKNPNLPVAVNDTVDAIAGCPVAIPVLQNDFDPNNDSLIIQNVGFDTHDGFCEFSDSIVTYTPYSYISKDVIIKYRIAKKNIPTYYSNVASIVVHVAENPERPVAVDDYITLNAFDKIEINPLLNDSDPNEMASMIYQISSKTGIRVESFADSLVTLKSVMNYGGTIHVPYTSVQVNNPAMVSNEAIIHIKIIPDQSMFYGVDDTITDWPGLQGLKNLISNDYNPGNSSLSIAQIHNIWPVKIRKYNDSTIYYAIGFAISEQAQTHYKISDGNDTLLSMAKIIFNIRESNAIIDALDINNINATFSTVGLHFCDPFENNREAYKFEVPKGSGKRTLYSNSLWIGGMADAFLHSAADNYRIESENFWAGPVSDSYQNEDLANYRVWKITKSEIDYHIAHFRDEGYEPIPNIKTWPGNGNTELGQALQLAPFLDNNKDGIFDPYAGDFPLIRGDQSLYFIFNDDYGLFSGRDGEPMKIEIHGNAYAFDQANDSALFNTIFLHYDIINRSDNTYTDTYIGLFNDFDLGYPYDNYIACDVGRGNSYIYNSNPVDGFGGPEAYGENPPVQGVVILGGAKLPDDYMDNPAGACDESINGLHFGDGIVDNERMGMTRFGYIYKPIANPTIVLLPQCANEFYNILEGRWKDNSPQLYGGIGHSDDLQTVGPECKFMFPGASDPLNWGTNCEFPNGGFNQNEYYWTEESQQNLPDGRRGISTTGPFTFAPGKVQSLDVAFVYARDNDTSDMISAIDIMNQRIDTIRNRVVRGEIIYLPSHTVGISEKENEAFEFMVFPNPSSDNKINIDLRKLISEGEITYQIKDIMRRNIQHGKLSAGNINTIEIENLTSGIYVIMVKQGNTSAVQKLMIR